jgi:hypothetical protein
MDGWPEEIGKGKDGGEVRRKRDVGHTAGLDLTGLWGRVRRNNVLGNDPLNATVFGFGKCRTSKAAGQRTEAMDQKQ